MSISILRFTTLLLAGLLAGALGLTVVLDRAFGETATFYIEFKQREVGSLTVLLPLLGILTTVLMLILAYLVRQRRRDLWLTLAGAACLLLIGALTAQVFFPLNAQIRAWSPQAPPADWSTVRDRWNQLHLLRVALGIGGFIFLLLGALSADVVAVEKSAASHSSVAHQL